MLAQLPLPPARRRLKPSRGAAAMGNSTSGLYAVMGYGMDGTRGRKGARGAQQGDGPPKERVFLGETLAAAITASCASTRWHCPTYRQRGLHATLFGANLGAPRGARPRKQGTKTAPSREGPRRLPSAPLLRCTAGAEAGGMCVCTHLIPLRMPARARLGPSGGGPSYEM